MFVAMVFGARYALILALLSPLLHNLFDVPPMLSFTWPTVPEIALAVFYMVLAIAVPWMIRLSARVRTAALRGSTNSPMGELVI
jgi:K+-sensing histidine kinase KdpD